ncbi:MAG TPA: hypothetical protein VK724_20690 [Bryobacteraceae bacterium]|jgi:hypothetical protein|nr:hypothetical protein [Bryobacteraceae bacterium]
MVLTKEELIAALQNEARILVHLAGKVDKANVDYRPAPKQRSILELLRYMSMMGPTLVTLIKAGTFDMAVWGPADAAAKARNFEQAVAAIEKQSDEYSRLLSGWTDADFRGEVEFFGAKASRGSHIVFLVVSGHAAYRTQLFLYLKACGREELTTMNLWGGADAPA